LQSNTPTLSPWSSTNYTNESAGTILGLPVTRFIKNATDNGLALGTAGRNVFNAIGTYASAIKSMELIVRKGNTSVIGVNFNSFRVNGTVESNPFFGFNFDTKTFINLRNGLTQSMLSFVDEGNDVFRIRATFDDVSSNTNKEIWLAPTDVGGAFGGDTATGNYFDFVHLQFENGSFSSSIMVTTNATVTRSADVITKTGASDLIGQTEGTLYAVVDARINSQGIRRIMVIDDGAETGSTALRMSTTNQVQLVSFNTTAQAVINSASNQQGLLKIAGVFAQDDFRLYVNGSLAGTDTSGTIPALRNVIRIGLSNDTTNQTHWFNDRILLAGISKTALTQAEAIALTT
jgi:hypothetical protein